MSSPAVHVSIVEEFRPRDYQLEMLERSLKRNVIIAMDTGSGKTEIAVMRIRKELDRCSDEKRIWFLAPTVTLCEQQHRYIQARLPEFSPLILVGASNVDSWSVQHIWDAALYNHRIVISTHAVLLDALRHGFVKLTGLALLVFDEAHHCTKNHAANSIMKEFYHEEKEKKGPDRLPHILGLSASPMRGVDVKEIGRIEKNLDSLCVTPRVYRQELLAHAHRPHLERIQFSQNLQSSDSSPALCTVKQLEQRMKNDLPGLLHEAVFQDSPPISPRSFEPREMKLWKDIVAQYRRKSETVYTQLGPWAMHYFIHKTNELHAHNAKACNGINSQNDKVLNFLLTRFFDQSGVGPVATSASLDQRNALSDKAIKLVELIAQQATETTIGLIFVRERIIVSLLFYILSNHPRTAKRFKFATFVGLSRSSKKLAKVHELLDLDSQKFCLDAFHAKRKHIIIATDVLEEGIDVAACNFVVCFDQPLNLKSFIQRRGRARKHKSRFVIMETLATLEKAPIQRWIALEEDMVRMCQDEERLRQRVASIESEDEQLNFTLRDDSTGAVLTADSVKSHLHHFCDTLPKQPFVETRPTFSIEESSPEVLTARVTLPNCVGSFPRSHFSSKCYRTERAAVKEAAFQCYQALYEAKLLNSHLLPNTPMLEERCQDLPSLVEVAEQIEPWRYMARAWSSLQLHKTTFRIEGKRLEYDSPLRISLITPMVIPPISSLTWSQHSVVITEDTSTYDTGKTSISPEELRTKKRNMATAFLPQGGPLESEEEPDYVYVFDVESTHELLRQPTTIERSHITMNLLEIQSTNCAGPYYSETEALAVSSHQSTSDGCEISRRITPTSHLTDRMSTVELHDRHFQETPPHKITPEVSGYARETLYEIISRIVGHVEKLMVATWLQTSLLSECKFHNPMHIVQALTAPSADAALNFERYEFLGDAVLQMVVTAQLFADRVSWPAGWLSQCRENLVSNESLANAALSLKIDQYILTKARRTANWTLPRIADLEAVPEKRMLSSKTLADVLQALFAAAYLDSGYNLARSCIEIFLPEVQSNPPVFPTPQSVHCSSPEMGEAQKLIGYRFRNITLLLQALTHPSCSSHGSEESYQRLAFLGDAILRFIIAKALFQQDVELREGRMTEVRAAVMNANMLGYICMVHSISREVFEIETNAPFGKFRREETFQLWKYMRSESQDVLGARKNCYTRFQRLHDDLHRQLQKGHSYPWVTLAELEPEGFYSELIQSVLGAIYVDSGGDWKECQSFVETVGICSYMERMVQADYDVVHPRSALHQLAPAAKVHVEQSGDDGFRGVVSIDEVGVENATAEGCRSRKHAEALASHQAVQILRGTQRRR